MMRKKKLGKNYEGKMTLYNNLPCKEYERVFMCKTAKGICHTLIITHQGSSQVKDYKIDLLTQQYEKFLIFTEETIDSGFTRFNSIITSLKSLDQDYSNENHVRKFLRALPEQTSYDNDSQGERDGEEDEDKEYNLMARNFQKFFRKGHGNGNRGTKSSRQKRGYYNYWEEGHFIGECPKPKENKAFVGGAWSDSEEGTRSSRGSQGNAKNRTRNEVSTTRVLELVHLNLFGPSSIQSYGDNFYTLMIVRDHSNYNWVVFHESKDDALGKFEILSKKLETLHDCSIVLIETNHTSEYDNMQLGSFYEQHVISYNLSIPSTSK
ncbi:retrovirus-related pol polyprotein from transposon TNT 1-94 [Tanacetum coccineum]